MLPCSGNAMSLALSGLALLSSVSQLCTGNGAAGIGGPGFSFLEPTWRGSPPTLGPNANALAEFQDMPPLWDVCFAE